MAGGAPVKVGNAVIDLSARAEGITQSITEAIESGGKSGGTAIKSSLGAAMGGVAKAGALAVAGATTALVGGVAALSKQAVSAYGEYEQLAGGIETLFGEAAPQAMKNAELAFKTAGMSTNQYMTTAIQSAAAMISSLDGDTKKAAEMVDLSITDMSDNVNKMGTTMEAVQNAYRGFSRGNFTMLDNLALGFAGTKKGMEELLERAQEISGVEYNIESYADIVQAIHVVQEEMGIAGTTAAEAAGTITGSLGSVKGAWENLVAGMANENADMGGLVTDLLDSIFGTDDANGFLDNMIPRIASSFDGIVKFVGTALPGLMSKMGKITEKYIPIFMESIVSMISSLAQSSPELVSTLISMVSMLLSSVNDALPSVLSSVLDAIIQTVTSLLANAPTLLRNLLSVVETVANFILQDGLPVLIAALPELIATLAEFILSASTQITEVVYKILFAIIDEAPSIILMLASVIPEIISALVMSLLEGAPDLSAAIFKLTVASLLILPAVIYEILSHIPEIFTAIVGGFQDHWGEMQDAGYDAFEAALEGMFSPEILSQLILGAEDIIDNAKETILGGVVVLRDAGKDLMDGLIDGVKSKIEEVQNVISGVASTVSTAFKKVLGISSPSKVFEEYGGYIDEGLALGIDGSKNVVSTATSNLSDMVKSGFAVPNYSTVRSSQPALAGAGGGVLGMGQGGNIIIPVYIGQTKIDELVVNALNANNYRSGGR